MSQVGAQPQADSSVRATSALEWMDEIQAHYLNGKEKPLQLAAHALSDHPAAGDLLLAAALAALLEERPEQSLRYQKRFRKHYFQSEECWLLQALTMAQQGRWGQAFRMIEDARLWDLASVSYYFPLVGTVRPWIKGWFQRIRQENGRSSDSEKKSRFRAGKGVPERIMRPALSRSTAAPVVPAPKAETAVPPLARLTARIPISIVPPAVEGLLRAANNYQEDAGWFRLRAEFARLSLLKGFDELLCLPLLRNVQTFWYQVETVRKVLKQFRGRVLLADEVGLGKTIEAGMVLKEYMVRGMVNRVLVLTPATMVGQWLEELATKFDLSFASSYDLLLRRDPGRFWAQPRVVASIATARRPEHQSHLAEHVYDLIIVDEAHHLKNRASENWKLVNGLQKRFLLLLSATPVQNSLVELYNVLTLLKPGIFKTQRDFANTYMMPGRPRVPANREQLRDLMRDVMIRNTRSAVDVRLPKRHALTLRLAPGAGEGVCYQELNRLVQEVYARSLTQSRLALRHLLAAAGSSPAAAIAALERFLEGRSAGEDWDRLYYEYRQVDSSCKDTALLEVLQRNPEEKKIVFVHHRRTLERLSSLLQARGIELVRFEGSMNGPEKDRAVEHFRTEVPLLLCTESGGEGRNLQFCHTLINYDLPWNPMAIEQRIGRLHRIGQTRDVFVFNLVVQNTLEEYVLRILDEKVNMFELVVGEVDAILGEMEESREFAEMVFTAWVESSEQERPAVFEKLGDQITEARRQYEAIRQLDDQLFGEDFVTG